MNEHVTKKEMINNLAAGQVELEDEIEQLKTRIELLERTLNQIQGLSHLKGLEMEIF